jgi:hypothetical protein
LQKLLLLLLLLLSSVVVVVVVVVLVRITSASIQSAPTLNKHAGMVVSNSNTESLT